MYRAWLGVFVSVTLVSILAQGAAAQSGPQFVLEAKVDQETKTIETDLGNVVFNVAVTVKPTQPNNPLRDQFKHDVAFTLEPAKPPNGYAIGLGLPADADCNPRSNTCVLETGKEVTVQVTVSAIISDPDVESTPFTLKMRSTPVFQGQPNPVTDALIAGASQSDDEQVEGRADLRLDASERVSSFVKRYPWFMIAGAAGIVLISVVLIRKRKGGLSVATDSPVQEVLPGRGASFPIQVTNEGGTRESLSLTTSDVPSGWSSILPVDKIDLAPNETTTIWLTLKAPSTAQPGEHIQVNFVATTGEGATAESLVEAVVVERYGMRMPTRAGAAAAAPVPQEADLEPPPTLVEHAVGHAAPRVAHVAPKRRKN